MALSRGSPRVDVIDHPAVWSPDLPHRAAKARRDRPADSPGVSIPPPPGELAGLGDDGALEDGGVPGHDGPAPPPGRAPARPS